MTQQLTAEQIQAQAQYAQAQLQQQAAPVQVAQTVWDPDLHIPGEGPLRNGCTVFLFGGIGTIKTTWAGTWPNPVFLSAGQEGGDDSLSQLPQLLGVSKPPVYQISSTKMMRDKVEYIRRMHKQYGWCTVVIDSVSMYFDIYIREIIEIYQNLGKEPIMQQRDWGFLEAHVCKEIAQTLHGTQLNVIWIALQKEKFERQRNGEATLVGVEPMMQGAAKMKLPAMCKMVIYADKALTPSASGAMVSTPVFHTSPSMLAKDVRHKYGNAFPEGKLTDPEFGTWPTFRAVDERIGQFIYKG